MWMMMLFVAKAPRSRAVMAAGCWVDLLELRAWNGLYGPDSRALRMIGTICSLISDMWDGNVRRK